ncbi:hypothetical protein [Sphingomonas cavernae]|uniref:Carbohydrate-binding family V/XII n=1 Tax=Sphingomonas cavernae TaxID=2320861 RepID=A0A418WKJ3_9SPHN|nr:hypothetical protein [Sphingomonas cavernae]RJF90452.1 hypothetical protein D3876_09435 [Sphingomonas cavernae]
MSDHAANRRSLFLAVAGLALFCPSGPLKAQSIATPVDARPFPRQFEANGLHFWQYPPQYESLSGNLVTGRAAVAVQTGETKDAQGKTQPQLAYGTVWLTGRAEIDKEGREATLTGLQVQRVSFPTQSANEARYRTAIQAAVQNISKVVSLDQIEASIALGQARANERAFTVQNAPPEIVFAFQPAVMVHLDGAAVMRPMKTAGVQRVINTRSLLLNSGGAYYLRMGGKWARATALDGPWTLATSVPDSVSHALAEAIEGKLADPMDKPADNIAEALAANQLPAIMVRTKPGELIPVAGDPQFEPIPGTQLSYVANSPADVFVQANKTWFVLISGRWFRAASTKGPWTYVASNALPPDFAKIPPDSPKSAVLASIAGTPEAQEALIANSVPQTASINRNQAKFAASYDGAPDFVPIKGTSLTYAHNSAVPVIKVDASHYYAVSNGVWFTAASPTGPWAVATEVAPAIYTIPSSSPLHYVTYVQVYGTSGDTVYVGYTPGYYGTVVSQNVVVYGTGYPCDPWVGSVWYGCGSTYGVGAYFGFAAAVGWTFGFGWGYDPWYDPWYGPYWPGYYYPWGAGYYYPVAGAWNVYGNWGNAVVSGTAAAWANPWTGNYGRAAEGSFYNQRTGGRGMGQAGINTNIYTGTTTAGARGVRYNPQTGRVVAGGGAVAYNPYTGQAAAAGRRDVVNTNTGRETKAAGAAGRGPEGAGAAGAFSSKGEGGDIAGAGHIRYDRDTGDINRGGVVKAGDDIYAGRNGNVWKKTDSGWQSMVGGEGSTRQVGPPDSSLDRDRMARDRGFDRSGAAAPDRLDRGAVRGGFQGRMGGERPAMNRMGGMRAGGFRRR